MTFLIILSIFNTLAILYLAIRQITFERRVRAFSIQVQEMATRFSAEITNGISSISTRIIKALVIGGVVGLITKKIFNKNDKSFAACFANTSKSRATTRARLYNRTIFALSAVGFLLVIGKLNCTPSPSFARLVKSCNAARLLPCVIVTIAAKLILCLDTISAICREICPASNDAIRHFARRNLWPGVLWQDIFEQGVFASILEKSRDQKFGIRPQYGKRLGHTSVCHQ